MATCSEQPTLALVESIFFKRYGNQNGFERNNFPIVFENSNGNSITPSQNFVDEFEVKNGAVSVPFDWSNLHMRPFRTTTGTRVWLQQ